MFAKPQAEHRWLDQLIGNWTVEQQCTMPDGTSSTTHGKMTVRSLGGLWLVCESSGESSEGDSWDCNLTLGFDPERKKYVGSFVGSMMGQLWLYEGVADESGQRLPLYCSGPKFEGPGTSEYRDTIEIVNNELWKYDSEVLGDDGNWSFIMKGQHRRATDE